jgi:HEAT repeat protein
MMVLYLCCIVNPSSFTRIGVMTIAQLIAALESTDPLVRRDARDTLITHGTSAIPMLVSALQSPLHHVRWETLKVLEIVGDASVAPSLLSVLADEDFGIRWMAAEILGSLGDAGMIPLLHAYLHDNGNSWMTDSVHHALRFYRGHFNQPLEHLLHALNENNDFSYVTWAAGQALRSLEERQRHKR